MPWTFEGIDENIGAREQPSISREQTPQEGFTFEGVEPIEKPSIGLSGQAVAGGASYFTWPADVFKAMARAQGLDILKEMGNDTPEAREAVERAASKIPTQQGLEDYLEKKTGYRFTPQSGWEKTFRAGGELFSPGGLMKGGVKQIAKTIGKRASAAGVGAGAQESLKEFGVHPAIAGLVGIGTSSMADVGRTFSKEGQSLKDFAQKHGLRESQYMVKKRPLIKGIIPQSKGEEILEEVGKTSKAAIDKIIHESNPVGRLKKEGVNVNEYVNNVLNKTRAVAQESPTKISLDPLIKSIDSKISSIKAEAPSLSDVDRVYISILEHKKNDFLKNPEASLEQHLNQYRKNNEDRIAFYKNPQMTHLQEGANNAYGFLNDELIKIAEDSAERTGSSEYVDLLKAGNKLHKHRSDLIQASSILGPFFEKPNISELKKVLHNRKNQQFLKRTLGEDSIKEINKIGKYADAAQEKLKKSFHQEGFTLKNLATSIGVLSALAIAPPTLARIADVGIIGMFVKGAILSNKNMRADVINLEKAIIGGSEKAIRKASSKLNSDFEAEYGDPYELSISE